jgi:glycosyltransferase involved in cell wall biosynthesis
MSMLKRAARVTVMTEASAARMRDEYDYDPLVLTPGIFVDDYNRRRDNDGPPTIVCAASLDDPHKRLDVLLGAFEILAARHDFVRLLLIGAGDPTGAAAQVAAMPEGIGSRVTIRRPTADMSSIYAGCTVGALTSTREAFGLVVLEYLAAGMPAVVSDDAGSTVILTEGTGITFQEGDIRGCSKALERALELTADPATTGRCRSRAREFDWSVQIRVYEELYRSLL